MNHDNAATARHFTVARLQGAALSVYPGSVPADLAAAYQVQHLAIDQWPDRLFGWKVARIAPSWQAQYPDARMIGPVFARNVHVVAPGQVAQCAVFAGGYAALEAEIGVYISTDAPADKTDWIAAQAADLVSSVCIGVEVASSPLATLSALGPGAVVSDFGNNWGVVIGASIPDWRTRAAGLEVETFVEGISVGRGTVVIVEAPLESVAFTLNKTALLGRPLRAGSYISTGMITGVHAIRSGERSRLVFGGYGEIECHAVAASPYGAEPK